MGKRSTFERAPRDFYPTPPEAVTPLLRHLARNTVYSEPCAGDGALIRHLAPAALCSDAMDIEPRDAFIRQGDALTADLGNPQTFITNPPWSRDVLHPLIIRLSDIAPTWLLFDADWIHTRQAVPFLPRLRRIVSVGRVKWIPDSPFTGKDNCCWYLFDRPDTERAVAFYGRAA
jgi:hypothetical protein